MKKFAIAFVLLIGAFLVTRSYQQHATPAAPKPATTMTTPAPVAPPPAPPPSSQITLGPAGTPPAGATANKPTLTEMLIGANRIYDAQIGMMVTYPKDWGVRDVTLRWGASQTENTIFLAPPAGSSVIPSIYYRQFTYPPGAMSNPEAYLRQQAQQKEDSRSSGGTNDYKNEASSFVYRKINGNPSLSYFATYTQGGDVHAEYFLRVLGPSGYVMFFNRGPAKEVQALIPTIADMANTVKPP